MHGLDPVLSYCFCSFQLSSPDSNSAFNSSIGLDSTSAHTRMSNWAAASLFAFIHFGFFAHFLGRRDAFILLICFPATESEPRDAGTDQKSSGIIRLHTIKQIIDRVR